jgi:hypothetical protein
MRRFLLLSNRLPRVLLERPVPSPWRVPLRWHGHSAPSDLPKVILSGGHHRLPNPKSSHVTDLSYKIERLEDEIKSQKRDFTKLSNELLRPKKNKPLRSAWDIVTTANSKYYDFYLRHWLDSDKNRVFFWHVGIGGILCPSVCLAAYFLQQSQIHLDDVFMCIVGGMLIGVSGGLVIFCAPMIVPPILLIGCCAGALFFGHRLWTSTAATRIQRNIVEPVRDKINKSI